MKQIVLGLMLSALVAGAEIDSIRLQEQVTGLTRRSWENGYFAAWNLDSSPLVLCDSKGTRLFAGQISIPGSAKTSITAVSIWPDGTMAVSGGFTAADGASNGFLAIVARDGKIERVVNTTPFIGWRLRIANNGTLWSFGRVISPPGAKDEPPHNMLRAFARDGRQLLEALPRKLFGRWPHPVDGGELVPFGDRMGILVGSTSEWLEVSPADGRLQKRVKFSFPGDLLVRGAVMSSRGELFVTGRQRRDNAPRLVRIDTESGVVMPVPMSREDTSIIGWNGDALVLSNAGPDLHMMRFP